MLPCGAQQATIADIEDAPLPPLLILQCLFAYGLYLISIINEYLIRCSVIALGCDRRPVGGGGDGPRGDKDEKL